MRESPRPFVFLGYVVTKPHEGNYHILMDDSKMHDIEPEDHDRWCEYIAFRGVNRVAYARISRGTITDTEVFPPSLHVLTTDPSGEIRCQGLSCEGTELSEVAFSTSSGILEIPVNVLWRG
jgi:hypothetical protein